MAKISKVYFTKPTHKRIKHSGIHINFLLVINLLLHLNIHLLFVSINFCANKCSISWKFSIEIILLIRENVNRRRLRRKHIRSSAKPMKIYKSRQANFTPVNYTSSNKMLSYAVPFHCKNQENSNIHV